MRVVLASAVAATAAAGGGAGSGNARQTRTDTTFVGYLSKNVNTHTRRGGRASFRSGERAKARASGANRIEAPAARALCPRRRRHPRLSVPPRPPQKNALLLFRRC